ncbi:hypothetical protein pb186bvf_012057 [Paramecium bursaria]
MQYIHFSNIKGKNKILIKSQFSIKVECLFKIHKEYSKNGSSRLPYQKITNTLRQQLITEIVYQGAQLKQTAEKYGLKYSTVKGIIQVFQSFGRSHKKEKRNRKYFMRRNRLLVLIDSQTGNLQLYTGQQLNQVEITQGKGSKVLEGESFQSFQSDHDCLDQFLKDDLKHLSSKIVSSQKARKLNQLANKSNPYDQEIQRVKILLQNQFNEMNGIFILFFFFQIFILNKNLIHKKKNLYIVNTKVNYFVIKKQANQIYSIMNVDKLVDVLKGTELHLQDTDSQLNKKDKRNRKFFLKKIASLIKVSAESGNIEIFLNENFSHVEILQGGHPPTHQQVYKEVRSESFINDQECINNNLAEGLRCISKKLVQEWKTLPKNKKEELCFQTSVDFTRFNILQLIEDKKRILNDQHMLLKNCF